MKNYQKGFVVPLLFGIITLLVIGVGAYIYFSKPKTYPPQPKNWWGLRQSHQPANQTNPSTTKIYTDKTFGFSFAYPDSLILATDTTGKINLSNPNTKENSTTITKAVGVADDSNGKWGTYIISYNNGWIVKLSSDYTQAITSMASTTSGLPIFNGGIQSHGWGGYTYIVALSNTKFLIINGPEISSGTDYTYYVDLDPTLKIAKTITQ